MKNDAMKLLKLMGFPVVEAKAEAEAQCVQLLRENKVFAVASDDMDCLTFGCKILIKGIKTKADPVVEINLDDVLKELGFTFDQFIDFCILCGCDYCGTIENVGPVKAYQFIKEHKTIENVLKAMEEENVRFEAEKNRSKYVFPPKENFDYETARELFKTPDVFKGLTDVI
jgi:flap endonuclease-1